MKKQDRQFGHRSGATKVVGFDNMSYEVKGQNEECGVAELSKEPAIFKDIHFGLCFVGVQSFNFDLKGQG